MVLELSAYVGSLTGGASGAGLTRPYSLSQIIDSAVIHSVSTVTGDGSIFGRPGLWVGRGRQGLRGMSKDIQPLLGLSGGAKLETMFRPAGGKKFLMQNPVLSPVLSIRLQSPGPGCFEDQ